MILTITYGPITITIEADADQLLDAHASSDQTGPIHPLVTAIDAAMHDRRID